MPAILDLDTDPVVPSAESFTVKLGEDAATPTTSHFDDGEVTPVRKANPAGSNKKLASKQTQMLLQSHQASTSKTWAADITHGRNFNIGMGFVMMLNALYLGLETDFAGAASVHPGTAWYAIEAAFTSVFLFEMLLRLAGERGDFFKDGWNIFDTILVGVSCADTFVIQVVTWGRGEAVDVIGVMRVLRSIRVVKVFRVFRFYRKLWQLVIGVVDAMRALVWAWLLIVVIIYVFAILMTRTLKVKNEELGELFGNVPMSMFTMFQVMTLEGWPSVARAAMKEEPWSLVAFLAFLILTTFSIMNVIIAVIVESTMEQANSNREEVVRSQEEELRKASHKVSQVFKHTDTDGNGQITKSEFHEAIKRDDVHAYLVDVGVDVRQAENLFDILDFDDSGSLDVGEFTSGILRSRGQAQAKDVLSVQCSLWRTEKELRTAIESLCRRAESRLATVDAEIDLLREDLQRVAARVGKTMARANSKIAPSPTVTSSSGTPAVLAQKM